MTALRGLALLALILCACGSTRSGSTQAGSIQPQTAPPQNEPPFVRAMVERLEQEQRERDAKCEAQSREGDALVAAGKRDEAIASYDRVRDACRSYGPVRRKLFLLRHPPPEPGKAPARTAVPGVNLGLIVENALGSDLELTGQAAFLDGVPFDEYAETAHPIGGVQELHVELWIRSRRGGTDTLIDVRDKFVVHPSVKDARPLFGAAVLRLRDRQDGTPITQRVQVELETRPLKPLAELQSDQRALRDRTNGLPPVMVAPNTGTGLRTTNIEATMPADVRRWRFWTLLKVCVNADGQVTRLSTIKASGLPSEQPIHDWVKTWQYRSHVVDAIPRPFCHPVRIEIR